ncbi:MAG: OmpH family outer membrane protein [Pseudomonadota bacterium]|nr:OmpH family outer membrane protein [Pseudomonadota bacterium]
MRANGRIKHGHSSIGLMLLALLLPLAAWSQTQKIGYVDMKRLLDNAPQVAAGRQRIEAEFRDRDQLLQAEQKRLEGLEARERRDAAVMPKTAADALQREIQTTKRNLERTRAKLNEELVSRRAEELNRRWPEITDVMIQYARDNGYDLLLPAPVLYASARVDITDELLARLRAQAATSRTP